MQAWSLDTLSSIRLRRNSPPSPHSRSLNKVGMIHHQRWQEDHTRASPGPCIPVQDWDRSDLPALTTKKFTEFDFKKDLQEDGEKDFRVMDLESCVLTPWVDKLPIIAHLVMTMFVSGNIARSQAPSLLSSSANPYQKKKKRCVSCEIRFRSWTRCVCCRAVLVTDIAFRILIISRSCYVSLPH